MHKHLYSARPASIFSTISIVIAVAFLGFDASAEDAVNDIFSNFEKQNSKAGPSSPPDKAAKAGVDTARTPASYHPKPRPKPKKNIEAPGPVVSPSQLPEHEVKSTSEIAPEARAVPDTVPTDSAPSEGPKDYGLTANWGGLRDRLEENGIGFAAVYKGEGNRVFSDGLERRSSYLQNLDLRLEIDAEKALNWKGTTFLVYGIGDWGANRGNTPSSYVGDSQGTSNIETGKDAFQLYEIWGEKKLANDHASILIGIHDLNSEFYVTDTSTLFLNSSLGVGKELSQTGEAGPSIFPKTTSALRLKVESPAEVYFQAGVFAANSDHRKLTSKEGYLLINELGFVGSERNPYKYGVGYWTYTSTFPDNDSGAPANSSGYYVLIDQPFGEKFSGFVRFGGATTKTNEVKDNLSVGVVGKGIIPGRDEDKIGLALTRVKAADSSLPEESAYEFSYRMELGHGLAIQPDLQLVKKPGFADEVKDALVGAIRLEVSL